MSRFLRRLSIVLFATAVLAQRGSAQGVLTWQQVQVKFDAANPSLRAGQVGIEESRAQEISAYLRPNPNLGLIADQINPFTGGPPHSTLGSVLSVATVSYLHERQHKRELRHESAQDSTKIAISGQDDSYRTLLFSLRQAFIQTLHEKAVLALAKENLSYYDHLLDVNRDRYKAGRQAHYP
jgi:cobalt-zinc-cadmium efflux system outer membrane protein